MSELKPCPFCGGEAKAYVRDYGDTHYWRVSCSSDKCGVNPVTNVYHTEAEAIDAWNTRAAYEAEDYFYLPKPKQGISFTSETLVKRTEHGYQIGAITDVYENAVKEWEKQLNDYIIGRICEVFRPERTCKVEGSYTDNWEYQTWGFELSCGHDVPMLFNEPPNYCPVCGAKVIGGNE